MQIGDKVQLRAYGGEIIIRRLVAQEKDVLYVCREETYRAATAEGREPVSVGFKVEYVVDS